MLLMLSMVVVFLNPLRFVVLLVRLRFLPGFCSASARPDSYTLSDVCYVDCDTSIFLICYFARYE